MTENQEQPIVTANGQLIKGLTFFREEIEIIAPPENIQPKINVSLNVNTKSLGKDVYEVALEIIAKANHDEREIFSIELDYAGIFTIKNTNKEQLEHVLQIHCPTLLFPFARRILAETTREGAFAPLTLEPVDFTALYRHKLEQQQAIKN